MLKVGEIAEEKWAGDILMTSSLSIQHVLQSLQSNRLTLHARETRHAVLRVV